MTTKPTTEVLLEVAQHLTDDFHGIDQALCDQVAEWLRAAATPPAPAEPQCATCGGHGMIGGPSYYAPDEGGEPCPACAAPAQQQDARDGARYRWMMSGAIVPMAGRDKPRIRSVMYGDGSGDKIAQVHAWGKQELIDAAIDAAMQQQGGGNDR